MGSTLPELGIISHIAESFTQWIIVKSSPSHSGGLLQKYLVKGLIQYNTEPYSVKAIMCNYCDASLLTGEYCVTGNWVTQ